VVGQERCFNSTHVLETYNFTLDSEGSVIEYNSEQFHRCLNGCSRSLGKCRWDEFWSQLAAFALVFGLVFIGILSYWVAGNYTPVLMILLFTFAFTIWNTDVFIGTNKLLLLIISFALLGMNLDLYLKYRKEEVE